MNETDSPTFFHTLHFNCSIIVMFFQLLIGFATIGTVAGIHALGVATSEELGLDKAAPARIEAPRPDPSRYPLEGVPVAFRGTGR